MPTWTPPARATFHVHPQIARLQQAVGQPIKQAWTITASDAYGLPVAGDEELFLALLDASRRQGFPEVTNFSRYELMRRMNWKPTGENYHRILDGLRRLSSVSFFAENAFGDNVRKKYVKELKFNIISEYAIADGERSQPSFPLSWVRWGQPVIDSIRAGNIKSLNLTRYFRLESSISRRLYRFLDKKFGYKHLFEINLMLLAHEHLGMTRAWRYPSDIRRRLEPCLKELLKDGYLAAWDYREKSGGGGMIISFERKRDGLPTGQDNTPSNAFQELGDNPAGWFVRQLTGAIQAAPADKRAAQQFVGEHGIEVFRDFAAFAADWREKNWPEMRTLSGAIKACSQLFFEDRAAIEMQRRQKEEEKHRDAWLTEIQNALEAYGRKYGDQVERFEASLQKNPEYKKALSQQDVYRGNEALRSFAQARVRSIRLESFIKEFPGCGVPPFDQWKP